MSTIYKQRGVRDVPVFRWDPLSIDRQCPSIDRQCLSIDRYYLQTRITYQLTNVNYLHMKFNHSQNMVAFEEFFGAQKSKVESNQEK